MRLPASLSMRGAGALWAGPLGGPSGRCVARPRSTGGRQMRDDAELVRRALDGEREAFDSLVARYHAMVYQQALRRVGHAQDAEEVAQNSFLKAYLGLRDLREPAGFGAWLRAITVRESISWLRGERPALLGSAEEAEEEPDRASTPEQALLERELRATVQEALAALPVRERRVAQAFYIEGRSYEEIQERTGLARSS